MTSATERLRALLDERGVKWESGDFIEPNEETQWGNNCYTDYPVLPQYLTISNCTPEQAIAATLGSSECECNSTISWTYSGTIKYYEHELSCGHVVTDEEQEPPAFCPACGKAVKQ